MNILTVGRWFASPGNPPKRAPGWSVASASAVNVPRIESNKSWVHIAHSNGSWSVTWDGETAVVGNMPRLFAARLRVARLFVLDSNWRYLDRTDSRTAEVIEYPFHISISLSARILVVVGEKISRITAVAEVVNTVFQSGPECQR